ncbi:MAG: hypothetical protein LW630_12440 [Saprospiraceae bacterium]|nr:hypothetical protein [Saprospiraceae bacterium]
MLKRLFIFIVLSVLLQFNLYSQTNSSFTSGAFLVNMGVSPQTVANSLKPYGMVYDLVQNYNVPVSWVIHIHKGKDGVDFIHNGVTYRGGSFVVPANYRTTVVNARIAYWQSLGVVGNTSVSALTLPVVQTFYSMPKWTLDATNGSIASGYLVNAGIPTSATNWLTPAQLTCCNDLFVMPHADPIWATHQNLVSWNQSCKGSIWAACHAISWFHRCSNPKWFRTDLYAKICLAQYNKNWCLGPYTVEYTQHIAW